MTKIPTKKTCLFFGEGGRELKFFRFIENTNNFINYYYKNWRILTDHASGSSCRVILQKCIMVTRDTTYNLVLCFIDTDKLYSDFKGKKIEKEKNELEKLAKEKNIHIVWQEKNHEDEMSRATKGKIDAKKGMKRKLKSNEEILMRSNFCKKIFTLMDSHNQ